MSAQFQIGFSQNLLLWLLAAFVLGLLVEWLLEIFFFRRPNAQAGGTLQGKRDTANAALSADKQSLTQFQSDLETHSADLDAARTGQAQLEAQLHARDQQLATVNAQLVTFQANLAQTRSEAEQQLTAVNAQLGECNATLEKTRAEHDAAQNARTSLEKDLSAAHSQVERVQQELAALQTEKADLAQQVATFTTGAAASAAALKALEQDKTAFSAKTGALQTDLDAARQSLAKFQTDLNACASARDAARAAQTQLQADLAARDQQLATVNAQLETLQANLAKTRNDSDRQLAAVNAQLGDLQAHSDKVQADYQAQLHAKAALDGELAKLRADFDAESNARGSLARELDGLRGSYTQLKGELAARQHENAVLRTELETTRGEKDSLSEKLALSGASVAAGVVAARATGAEASAYQARIRELENELAALKRAPALPVVSSTAAVTTGLDAPGASAPHGAGPAAEKDVESLAAATPHPRGGAPVHETPRHRDPDDETAYTSTCPQHLSDVYGIGTVFEGRLYAAGIGTYWELYKTPFDTLLAVLQVKGVERESIDLHAIRADALRLARETASKGRTWTASAPDDFEPIHGIGFTFEKRLYDAGICTYEALAAATPGALEQICGKGAVRKPDFDAWIKEAKELAAKKQMGATGSAHPNPKADL